MVALLTKFECRDQNGSIQRARAANPDFDGEQFEGFRLKNVSTNGAKFGGNACLVCMHIVLPSSEHSRFASLFHATYVPHAHAMT